MSNDVGSWSLIVYGDGAFANLPDKVSSGGGHIIFLCDKEGKSCPITWAANKIQRVVRSSLAAEALTMQESFGDGLYVKALLCELLGDVAKGIKVKSITDSRSLKKNLAGTALVADKMLRIDIASIKQMLERNSISITWTDGKQMIADALSKRQSSKDLLIKSLSSGHLDFV